MTARVIHADCLDAMRAMPDASIDAIVTDPPYGLSSGPTKYLGDEDVRVGGFMGKSWDHGVPGPAFWIEALRVAKPGAYLVAFGGTRTFHRLACAIEDAGWEIRDCFSWLYGSGFPKSLNVQQAINKAARGFPQGGPDPTSPNHGKFKGGCTEESPAGRGFGAGAAAFMEEMGSARGDDEGPWNGWGTALKPAWEPIILARKPLVGTVAANVLAHGTGAINVDGCRIGFASDADKASAKPQEAATAKVGALAGGTQNDGERTEFAAQQSPLGRWPANVALDEEAAAMLGEPARFFYTAKASRSERNDGCDGIEARPQDPTRDVDAPGGNNPRNRGAAPRVNSHPTVKPVALMRWLVRMVTPPGGVVLDPFCGSGTTLVAAIEEGFDCIGVEREAEYVAIIEARVAAAQQRPQRVAKPQPKRQPVKVQPAATASPRPIVSAPLPGQLALAWGAE